MLNDTDMERAPFLTKDEVSKVAFDEGLAILYHAISTFQAKGLTWEQAMQAAAILACQSLKETQLALVQCRENSSHPLRVVR